MGEVSSQRTGTDPWRTLELEFGKVHWTSEGVVSAISLKIT